VRYQMSRFVFMSLPFVLASTAWAQAQDLPSLPPIPEVTLGPVLPTTPVKRGNPGFNWVKVDTALLPIESDNLWVLEFSFKPLRIVEHVTPDKGRRKYHYMYYKVVNRTGKPRMFVPQFVLVTDTGKRYEDAVLPAVVKQIQGREDPTTPLLGAVTNNGMIPASTKEGIDDAVFGVAIWDGVDRSADGLKVYVRGLSDGLKEVTLPQAEKPTVQYKTLRIDFIRRGDNLNIHEKEIELLDPPYDWIYW
jgi:hypothetical protein